MLLVFFRAGAMITPERSSVGDNERDGCGVGGGGGALDRLEDSGAMVRLRKRPERAWPATWKGGGCTSGVAKAGRDGSRWTKSGDGWT